jgi:hypothetical protein
MVWASAFERGLFEGQAPRHAAANARVVVQRMRQALDANLDDETRRMLEDMLEVGVGDGGRPTATAKPAEVGAVDRGQEETRQLLGEIAAHINKSPIGWHNGRSVIHRATTEAEIVAWLQELESLAELGRATAKPTTHGRIWWRARRWIWPLTGWWSDYRWISRR